MTRIIFENLPSTSTPLNAENLNNNFAELETKIDNASEYSTTEKPIGTWINGKILYRKVFNIGSLPNAGSKDTVTDLPISYNIINAKGFAVSSNAMVTIPSTNATNISYSISLTMLQANGYWKITTATGIDRSAFNGYITLEYTK